MAGKATVYGKQNVGAHEPQSLPTPHEALDPPAPIVPRRREVSMARGGTTWRQPPQRLRRAAAARACPARHNIPALPLPRSDAVAAGAAHRGADGQLRRGRHAPQRPTRRPGRRVALALALTLLRLRLRHARS
jgi:hypothetical protein